MNNLPLVSICLLTYNQEKYISESIDGVLKQSYTPLEIIISDDNSQDSTFEIITKKTENYKGPHNLIVRRNESNLGLVKHVNKLTYELVNGEFIFFSAGDDVSIPERIEKSIQFISKNPDVVALSSSLTHIDDDSNLINNQSKDLQKDFIYDINYYLSNEYKHINGASRVIRRSLIDSFPRLNEDCPTEDTTFLFRAFLLGKVAILNDRLVKYRIHERNMSSVSGLKKMNTKKIIEQYYLDLNYAKTTGLIDFKTYQLLKIKINEIDISRNNKGFFSKLQNRVQKKLITLSHKIK